MKLTDSTVLSGVLVVGLFRVGAVVASSAAFAGGDSGTDWSACEASKKSNAIEFQCDGFRARYGEATNEKIPGSPKIERRMLEKTVANLNQMPSRQLKIHGYDRLADAAIVRATITEGGADSKGKEMLQAVRIDPPRVRIVFCVADDRSTCREPVAEMLQHGLPDSATQLAEQKSSYFGRELEVGDECQFAGSKHLKCPSGDLRWTPIEEGAPDSEERDRIEATQISSHYSPEEGDTLEELEIACELDEGEAELCDAEHLHQAGESTHTIWVMVAGEIDGKRSITKCRWEQESAELNEFPAPCDQVLSLGDRPD